MDRSWTVNGVAVDSSFFFRFFTTEDSTVHQGWLQGIRRKSQSGLSLAIASVAILALSLPAFAPPVAVLAADNDATTESGGEPRIATRSRLPTDRSYRTDGPFPFGDPTDPEDNIMRLPLPEHALPPAWGGDPTDGSGVDHPIDKFADGELRPGEMSAEDLAALRRPRFSYVGEYSPGGSDFPYWSHDFSVRVPTYPFYGPPPPMLNAGFSYTIFENWRPYDLADELYEGSLTASWLRRINERWMLRMSAGAAFASDGRNTSSDAWQFRGGVFGLYQQNEAWQWVFGALATGRRDLPVIPAIGAVWQPSETVRVDLLLPRPRISMLTADIFDEMEHQHLWMFPFSVTTHRRAKHFHRQRWIYLQGGFTGGTWAYERSDLSNDVLTYREWRIALGWETVPAKKPGQFVALGPTFGVEVAYSFGREFEFDSDAPDVAVDDGILLRMIVRP